MARPNHLRDLFNPLHQLYSKVLHSLLTPSLHSLFTSSPFTSSISLHSPHSSPTSHSRFTPSILTPSPLIPSPLTRSSLTLPSPFSHCSLFNCSSSRHICSPVFGLFLLQPCIHEYPTPSRYISGSRQQDAHQSFEDHSLILEPAKLHRRRRKLHHRASSHQYRARITEEARLTRLEKHGEKIQRFLTRQYPTIEAAKGTHWYKVYNKVQNRIRLHRLAIAADTDLLSGLSALSL